MTQSQDAYQLNFLCNLLQFDILVKLFFFLEGGGRGEGGNTHTNTHKGNSSALKEKKGGGSGRCWQELSSCLHFRNLIKEWQEGREREQSNPKSQNLPVSSEINHLTHLVTLIFATQLW